MNTETHHSTLPQPDEPAPVAPPPLPAAPSCPECSDTGYQVHHDDDEREDYAVPCPCKRAKGGA